ncbi:hypothetical protein ACOME3_009652 [Neoechinorhynchus agilis]
MRTSFEPANEKVQSLALKCENLDRALLYVNKKSNRFTVFELSEISKLYDALAATGPDGKMGYHAFYTFARIWLGMENDLYIRRLYNLFEDSYNAIKFKNFLAMLQLFLCGTFDELIEYAFKYYCISRRKRLDGREDKNITYWFERACENRRKGEENQRKFMDFLMGIYGMKPTGSCDLKNFRRGIYRCPWTLTLLAQCIPLAENRTILLKSISSEKADLAEFVRKPLRLPKTPTRNYLLTYYKVVNNLDIIFVFPKILDLSVFDDKEICHYTDGNPAPYY